MEKKGYATYGVGAVGGNLASGRGQRCGTTKVAEARAVAVAEHLAEGCSLKATARLTQVDVSVVRRLNQKVGEHSQAFHDERVRDLTAKALQADERHGYVHDKKQPQWEGELIDLESKFVITHVQGRRDEALIRRLLQDGASRLANRHQVVLVTDGDTSYATLFPEVFGQPFFPTRKGGRGRPPAMRYRIPRSLAHVQIIKHREGNRVVSTETLYTHGTRACVHQALHQLGYARPSTSTLERRNATARRMSAHQVRRSLAFSRRSDTKLALGWWCVTVYNWCRPHRSLRLPLATPRGKKNSNPVRLLWPSASPNVSGLSNIFFSPLSFLLEVGDNLIELPNMPIINKNQLPHR